LRDWGNSSVVPGAQLSTRAKPSASIPAHT
jgi:hypothetical protein